MTDTLDARHDIERRPADAGSLPAHLRDALDPNTIARAQLDHLAGQPCRKCRRATATTLIRRRGTWGGYCSGCAAAATRCTLAPSAATQLARAAVAIAEVEANMRHPGEGREK